MRRRLRKKKRLGESSSNCFEVTASLDSKFSIVQCDTLFDRFIEMIDKAGLQLGGGGGPHEWSVVIESQCGKGLVTEEHRESVRAWLEDQVEVSKVSIGELYDP